MRLACAQYPVTRHADFAAWQDHAEAWVAEAAQQHGAQLLLFPEYGGMELTALLPPALQDDLTGQIAALQEYHAAWRDTWSRLAQRHGVHIVAPSLPVGVDGAFCNRAYVLAPGGGIAWQDKRQMTRFELESWSITGGAGLRVFDAAIGGASLRFGVAICYDIEFPLIAQAMAAAGADLVLVPSCTDTLAGAHRVQVGARARALENQIYVAVSPTVGDAPWSPALDVNVGWASVLAAPDRGLPDDGIITSGTPSAPGWVCADLDFAALHAAREIAQVFTRRDWPAQALPSLEVATVTLG